MDMCIEIKSAHHEIKVVSQENCDRQRTVNNDGEETGNAEIENGSVDAGLPESFRLQDGENDDNIADKSEDEGYDSHRGANCQSLDPDVNNEQLG